MEIELNKINIINGSILNFELKKLISKYYVEGLIERYKEYNGKILEWIIEKGKDFSGYEYFLFYRFLRFRKKRQKYLKYLKYKKHKM